MITVRCRDILHQMARNPALQPGQFMTLNEYSMRPELLERKHIVNIAVHTVCVIPRD